ncbi:MAG TPA: peptide-methionine (S)-S-oxide reductase MsrA [Acetobacteraceae bacterium]|nr:peptide-methionine (S)-S-oxide reductase MsrA [Acetobacteraceae bacterium]
MMRSPIRPRRRGIAALLGLGMLAALVSPLPGVRAEGVETPLPPPPAAPAAPGGVAVAVLSGGCFWGVQGVFAHVAGVRRVVAGYAGGARETAQYEKVGTGTTGHAESVRITFDPARISYGEILRIFFSVALDPTEIDRQGPDAGPQYRSEIFTENPEQARLARAYIAALDAAGVFPARIATRVDPDTGFFPAEDYHQDFLVRHPDNPYIVAWDLPKLERLRRLFLDRYRPDPVLALPGSSG